MGLPPYKGAVTTLNDQSIKRIIPPPVGKAGFEVWVLTKGGLVCIATDIATCRSVRTVGSHYPEYMPKITWGTLGTYAEPSGACVYRYDPVTKSNPFLHGL